MSKEWLQGLKNSKIFSFLVHKPRGLEEESRVLDGYVLEAGSEKDEKGNVVFFPFDLSSIGMGKRRVLEKDILFRIKVLNQRDQESTLWVQDPFKGKGPVKYFRIKRKKS